MSQNFAPLVIGTAGHIDHGKTSLVEKLTGTNTDRLDQEISRGISIELGFAELCLKSGRRISLIDVPGHEKFIRHMIAGASGIDMGMLLIAADDGIMPQTREHIKIMQLLGIEQLVVVLSKVDLVDEEWRELVVADIKSYLQDSVYKDSPIVACSAKTCEGLDELDELLERSCAQLVRKKIDKRQARMPIDRSFSLKGIGTVVTGTLWSGTIEQDSELMIYPREQKVRLRNIQVHGKDCQRAHAGQRVALNLAGCDSQEISRGDVIAKPGSLKACHYFDAHINYLGKEGSDKPLVSGARVHINHGTKQLIGRILLMNEQQELQRGELAYAQIRLEEPLFCKDHDRFIIRSYSPVELIGGGEIILCNTSMRTKLSATEQALLDALRRADQEQATLLYCLLQKTPKTAQEIASALELDGAIVSNALEKHRNTSDKLNLDSKLLASIKKPGEKPYYLAKEQLGTILEHITENLLCFHKEQKLHSGMSEAALAASLHLMISPSAFSALIHYAQERGILECDAGLIAHPSAGMSAKKAQADAENKLETYLIQAGLTAAFIPELAQELGLAETLVKRSLRILSEQDRAVKITAEYFISNKHRDSAQEKLHSYLQQQNGASTSELRELLGISRKFALPLLEYFDACGLCYREGDKRYLRS